MMDKNLKEKYGCLCCDGKSTSKEIRERHGTIGDFKRSVMQAVNGLMISPSEANAAIKKYDKLLWGAHLREKELRKKGLNDGSIT